MTQLQTPRLGDFELLVALTVAALRDDAYGAALTREIEEQTGRAVSLGAVYKTLERLERKAMVASSIGRPSAERGGRRRKVYTLTATGKLAVRCSLEDIDRLRARAELFAHHRATTP